MNQNNKECCEKCSYRDEILSGNHLLGEERVTGYKIKCKDSNCPCHEKKEDKNGHLINEDGTLKYDERCEHCRNCREAEELSK